MDKKQLVISGFFAVYILIIFLEFVLLPYTIRNYDLEEIKRIIVRDYKIAIDDNFIDIIINNPSRLQREIQSFLDEIKTKKENIIHENRKYKSNIEDIIEYASGYDFNIVEFDNLLNKIIEDNKLNFSLGLAHQGEEETREYVFEEQNLRVRRATVLYSTINYSIQEVDFLEFMVFLDKLNEFENMLLIGNLSAERSNNIDGRVNIDIQFLNIIDIKGKTSDGTEVGLI
ncbi:MAG: hypothetical protein ACQESP_04080 [Candidatus Muiribacteriota bacterium]